MIISCKDVRIHAVNGLPVQEAVVTRGRERGIVDGATWGLRPKMQVVFSFAAEEPPSAAVWFKGTVKVLSENDNEQEFSYQEQKYAKLPTTEYWKEQFELEKSKWQFPVLEEWNDFASMRTFWPTDAGGENGERLFAFDYYPCSFWLEEGYTHAKMELKLQISRNSSQDSAPIETAWSPPYVWNTFQCYKESRNDIQERLLKMKQQGLNLDGYSLDLETRLERR